MRCADIQGRGLGGEAWTACVGGARKSSVTLYISNNGAAGALAMEHSAVILATRHYEVAHFRELSAGRVAIRVD